MFKLPDTSQTHATIVGIDPGTETLGLAELNFDIRTLELISWEATTYIGSKLLHGSRWLGSIHGGRFDRLQAHRRNLIKVFDQIEPLMIACEVPFINMRRPQAYGALTEAVYEIRLAVVEHCPWKPLHLYEPSTVKNGIGAKGNADKDAVKAALLKRPELVACAKVPIEELDEHSLDGLAVAFTAWLNLKQNANPLFKPAMVAVK